MISVGTKVIKSVGQSASKCPILSSVCGSVQRSNFWQTARHFFSPDPETKVRDQSKYERKGYETNCPFAQLMYFYRDFLKQTFSEDVDANKKFIPAPKKKTN